MTFDYQPFLYDTVIILCNIIVIFIIYPRLAGESTQNNTLALTKWKDFAVTQKDPSFECSRGTISF